MPLRKYKRKILGFCKGAKILDFSSKFIREYGYDLIL